MSKQLIIRSKPFSRHGHAFPQSPTYKSWFCMKQRCTNPKRKEYLHYGGRGIAVCKRWKLFINFLADMGVRPDGTSLERKDNEKGYFKSNCRWATQAEQVSNSRRNWHLTLDGKTQTTRAWERERGLGRGTIGNRLRNGWGSDLAISTPSLRAIK